MVYLCCQCLHVLGGFHHDGRVRMQYASFSPVPIPIPPMLIPVLFFPCFLLLLSPFPTNLSYTSLCVLHFGGSTGAGVRGDL